MFVLILLPKRPIQSGPWHGLRRCYTDFPSGHWTRIRTNNVMERMNREIRRRTRVVGRFPEGNSALMLSASPDMPQTHHGAARGAQRTQSIWKRSPTTPSLPGDLILSKTASQFAHNPPGHAASARKHSVKTTPCAVPKEPLQGVRTDHSDAGFPLSTAWRSG